MNFIGELAAIGTSVCFSFGSSLFTLSGRRMGALIVNRMRLLVAFIMIALVHWVMRGQLLPLDATSEQWFWMMISGFVGFVVGDALLFQGFVMVGPRLSMLMMALAPVWSVVIAWLFLDEILSKQELLGIMLTIGGTAWVVLDRNGSQLNIERREYIIGLLYGLGGSMGQAGGLIFSKLGLADDFSAISGSVIRLLTAMIVMWLIALFRGQIKHTLQVTRENPRAFWMLVAASISGPVLGVTLSLIALQHAPVGIVATLTSLPPIFLIPIGYVFFKERITMWAVIGTIIAFVGTAMLFL